MLTVRGPVKVTATNTATELTRADAEIGVGLAGVGAAIAIGVVIDGAHALLGRSVTITTTDPLEVRALTYTPSTAKATAGASGGGFSTASVDKTAVNQLLAIQKTAFGLLPRVVPTLAALGVITGALAGVTNGQGAPLSLPVTQAIPNLSPVVGLIQALVGLPVPLPTFGAAAAMSINASIRSTDAIIGPGAVINARTVWVTSTAHLEVHSLSQSSAAGAVVNIGLGIAVNILNSLNVAVIAPLARVTATGGPVIVSALDTGPSVGDTGPLGLQISPQRHLASPTRRRSSSRRRPPASPAATAGPSPAPWR